MYKSLLLSSILLASLSSSANQRKSLKLELRNSFKQGIAETFQDAYEERRIVVFDKKQRDDHQLFPSGKEALEKALEGLTIQTPDLVDTDLRAELLSLKGSGERVTLTDQCFKNLEQLKAGEMNSLKNNAKAARPTTSF